MDVSAFRRVLVAGFICGGTDDVDANLETVRLLRSQLRSKSNLRVIEAEVLPLAELAADKAKAAPPPSADATTGRRPSVAADVQAPAPTARPRRDAADSRKPSIRTARISRSINRIFADVAFWKKLGEEYENPLIVTGTSCSRRSRPPAS